MGPCPPRLHSRGKALGHTLQMRGDLLAAGPVAAAQRARRVLACLGDKAQDGLIALLALVLRVITLAPAHLVAEQRLYCGVGVYSDLAKLHVRPSPTPPPHPPLHCQK